MKILLIRHAQSNGNATGDYSTEAHDSLSPTGLIQAEELAARLTGQSFDFLYVSPLERAVQTALPLARERHRRFEIWPELAESCWQEDRETGDPATDYRPASSRTAQKQEFFYFLDNKAFQPTGDESYPAGLQRVKTAADRLQALHAGTNASVLIISHGYTLSRLIEYLTGCDPRGRFNHDNTGMSLIQGKPPEMQAAFINRCY